MIIRSAIELLINNVDTLENKHEVLTSIGLSTTSKEIFKICEKIRNDLPEHPSEIQVRREELLRGRIVQFIEDTYHNR